MSAPIAPRYARIVWTDWTNGEPTERLEVSDDAIIWRVATDEDKRAVHYLGKGVFYKQ